MNVVIVASGVSHGSHLLPLFSVSWACGAALAFRPLLHGSWPWDPEVDLSGPWLISGCPGPLMVGCFPRSVPGRRRGSVVAEVFSDSCCWWGLGPEGRDPTVLRLSLSQLALGECRRGPNSPDS